MEQNVFNIKLIKEFMSDHELTKSSFSKACGISILTLEKVLRGDTNLYIPSLTKIAKFIGVRLNDLFAIHYFN